METSKKRWEILDTYRGFVILHMVVFHFLFDLYDVFGVDRSWYDRDASRLWQQFICISFILLSGWVWRYGRHHRVRRGLLLNAAGLVITAVTLVVVPDNPVLFGVLNLLGCAALLLIPMEKLLRRLPAWAGLAGSLFLFILLRRVPNRIIGLGPLVLCRLPRWLYASGWLAPLGFPPPGFTSSDYFPLLPWFFLFVAGYFLGRWVTATPFWEKIAHVHVPPLSFLGRHSLLIYLLHQPLCYSICWLITR